MKRCIDCHAYYQSSLSNCSSCGFAPLLKNGFDCYASDFFLEGEGFKPAYFAELVSLEEGNFWFHSRNQLILYALKQYCSDFQSFLEIGCGTGYVLSGVSKQFPHVTCFGSEIFVEGLEFAAKRLPSAYFMQMDARNIPFKEEFDVIGTFDMLEHIKEDECVLAQISTALKPRGFLLLTVPQHPWLWSFADEYACHVRRYTASDLHQKVRAAGFKILRSTSFMTLLLPAMMLSRMLQKKITNEKFDPASEMKISPWLNSLFIRLLSFEKILLKKGLDFSVGGSRLVIAQKIN